VKIGSVGLLSQRPGKTLQVSVLCVEGRGRKKKERKRKERTASSQFLP
jgi:hypothetical protein